MFNLERNVTTEDAWEFKAMKAYFDLQRLTSSICNECFENTSSPSTSVIVDEQQSGPLNHASQTGIKTQHVTPKSNFDQLPSGGKRKFSSYNDKGEPLIMDPKELLIQRMFGEKQNARVSSTAIRPVIQPSHSTALPDKLESRVSPNPQHQNPANTFLSDSEASSPPSLQHDFPVSKKHDLQFFSALSSVATSVSQNDDHIGLTTSAMSQAPFKATSLSSSLASFADIHGLQSSTPKYSAQATQLYKSELVEQRTDHSLAESLTIETLKPTSQNLKQISSATAAPTLQPMLASDDNGVQLKPSQTGFTTTGISDKLTAGPILVTNGATYLPKSPSQHLTPASKMSPGNKASTFPDPSLSYLVPTYSTIDLQATENLVTNDGVVLQKSPSPILTLASKSYIQATIEPEIEASKLSDPSLSYLVSTYSTMDLQAAGNLEPSHSVATGMSQGFITGTTLVMSSDTFAPSPGDHGESNAYWHVSTANLHTLFSAAGHRPTSLVDPVDPASASISLQATEQPNTVPITGTPIQHAPDTSRKSSLEHVEVNTVSHSSKTAQLVMSSHVSFPALSSSDMFISSQALDSRQIMESHVRLRNGNTLKLSSPVSSVTYSEATLQSVSHAKATLHSEFGATAKPSIKPTSALPSFYPSTGFSHILSTPASMPVLTDGVESTLNNFSEVTHQQMPTVAPMSSISNSSKKQFEFNKKTLAFNDPVHPMLQAIPTRQLHESRQDKLRFSSLRSDPISINLTPAPTMSPTQQATYYPEPIQSQTASPVISLDQSKTTYLSDIKQLQPLSSVSKDQSFASNDFQVIDYSSIMANNKSDGISLDDLSSMLGNHSLLTDITQHGLPNTSDISKFINVIQGYTSSSKTVQQQCFTHIMVIALICVYMNRKAIY